MNKYQQNDNNLKEKLKRFSPVEDYSLFLQPLSNSSQPRLNIWEDPKYHTKTGNMSLA